LDCEHLADGRVRSRLLDGLATSNFYTYQISGAVGCILKMYGKVDADKLLRGTNNTKNPRAKDVQNAAASLQHLLVHGCILADEVGLGKTKQSLLAALLHILLYDITDKDDNSKVLYMPMLLLVPPTLINQWLHEIREYWPCFKAHISYSDHMFKESMALSSITHAGMKEYQKLQAIPARLKYIFHKSDPKAKWALIISSYETHKLRTGEKKQKKIPCVAYKKKRYDDHGNMIWKKDPQIKEFWTTNHINVYSLLIADEAQRIKNCSSGTWSILFLQSYYKTMLVTATPVYNSIKASLPPVLPKVLFQRTWVYTCWKFLLPLLSQNTTDIASLLTGPSRFIQTVVAYGTD
jgi:SNF2 family DNA or RNA helicase